MEGGWGAAAPSDRCPYPKPFPADFEDCPAYQPVRFIPLDTRFRPLNAVWSCAHLDFGEHGARAYARCRLGNAAEREAWAEQIRGERLDRWRQVAREFGEALKELLAAVYTAKAAQVAAFGTADAPAAEAELGRRVQAFLDRDFELMDQRAIELEAIGFPVEAMKVVTSASMAALVRRPRVLGSYDPPAELLAPFSPEIAGFVRGLFSAPPAS